MRSGSRKEVEAELRPSSLVAASQTPKASVTHPLPLLESEGNQMEDTGDKNLQIVSTPVAVARPSFSLHKNYTPPTALKPAHAPACATQTPFKPQNSSTLPPPSSSSSVLHKSPTTFVAPRQSEAGAFAANQTPALAAAGAADRIFACMFTKVSKKKHKTWSDGFIVLNLSGKKLILKDTEGKDIGKMSWQSPSFTSDLKSGSVMNFVCGYDVELCQEIELSQYTSGQCFLSKSKKVASVSSIAVVSGLKATPFLAHSDGSSAVRKAPAPLHNPDDPGAVVLVAGNSARGTVAIVLEPRLASLLRPHQLDGITFCITCLLGGEPERTIHAPSGRQFAPGHLPDGRSLAAFQGGAILADDMGLGKTAQSLAIAYTLIRQGPFGEPCAAKALIVCPTTLTFNWNREIIKWIGMERVRATVVSSGDQALSQINEFITSPIRKICIISYELLSKYAEVFSKCSSIGLLICDEAHRLKTKTLNITKKAILGIPTRRRLLLSGTPIQNNLDELYSLCSIVQPLALDDYDVFKNIFSNPIVASRDPAANSQVKKLGAARASELADITRRFLLRRVTDDIMTALLPPRTDYVIFVNMGLEQAEAYKGVIDALRIESSKSAAPSATALSLLQIMRRVCNHPSLLHESGSSDPKLAAAVLMSPAEICALSPKLALLNRILDAAQATREKTVVVSSSTKVLDLIAKMRQDSSTSCVRLDGGTKHDLRAGLVDRFQQDPNISVFLLSTKAGGVGLNLVAASRLILIDLSWNPSDDAQACARIWREGQKRNVSIVRIVVCGSIEEKILQRQMQKADMASVYFDAKGGDDSGGANAKSAIQISAKELRDVFRIPGDLTKCAPGTVQFVQDRKQKRAVTGAKRRLEESDSDSQSDEEGDSGKKKMWCGLSWTPWSEGDVTKLPDHVVRTAVSNVQGTSVPYVTWSLPQQAIADVAGEHAHAHDETSEDEGPQEIEGTLVDAVRDEGAEELDDLMLDDE